MSQTKKLAYKTKVVGNVVESNHGIVGPKLDDAATDSESNSQKWFVK
jgi:hypothetical protein